MNAFHRQAVENNATALYRALTYTEALEFADFDTAEQTLAAIQPRDGMTPESELLEDMAHLVWHLLDHDGNGAQAIHDGKERAAHALANLA
ncbi:hypothetical protein [Arsenicicoccus dermatophilus]|uniref:hypothetical protein n=1 Tax=Arsenicicoccus dermatophilus TaxID=1076331 RepID=UPI001F4C78CD|nr:hypothetical protein [Arsenicicoccus dermatophilus]MCH8611781.1 hypothetical protein [Arsenicicoccus dermatophilus]